MDRDIVDYLMIVLLCCLVVIMLMATGALAVYFVRWL